MSSMYPVFPSAVVGKRTSDRMYQDSQHTQPTTPSHLSSNYIQSSSASPTLNDANTPAESILSIHYQSSIYSELADDPFCGVDFNALGGASPSFLDSDEAVAFINSNQTFVTPPEQTGVDTQGGLYHPPSPNYTPSQYATSPSISHTGLRSINTEQFPPASVSPQELSHPFSKPPHPFAPNNQSTYTFTPSTSGSGQSSDDGLTTAVAPHAMPLQSPHVMVSVWENDSKDVQPIFPAENPAATGGQPTASSNMVATASVWPADRSQGCEESTGRGGIAPDNRPTIEIPSLKETTAKRETEEKNKEVSEWLSGSANPSEPSHAGPGEEVGVVSPYAEDDNISPKEIPLGDQTENKMLPGQTYFLENGGEMTARDIAIMKGNRTFADAPLLPNIHTEHHQPGTSQQAIEKFERMIRDIDQNSMLSRAATWGTRRRSFGPASSVLDYEEDLSGNFLRKMNLGKTVERRPSIFSRVQSLVKRPSVGSKRSRPSIRTAETSQDESLPSTGRRESRDSLQAPSRTSSGGLGGTTKRQQVPSINTAFFSMGASVASIGSATHARSGSIGTTTPTITSPKSPNTLSVVQVKNLLRRPRSGSELANLMRKTGGPPVARLAKTTSASTVPAPVQVHALAPGPDVDSDEDEEDLNDDGDEQKGVANYIDDLEPTVAGFKEHVLKLNPILKHRNPYLADRIAYHQVSRYKLLLGMRLKHLNSIANQHCVCGTMCIALGGCANVLDGKGDSRHDPLSASGRYDVLDGDLTPLEGAVSHESFPQGIPMPPTTALPAEFECQLCFQAKKFNKPSDWTKHVHEDVQPFTCTWDRCREPKTFKRKADWVRHENEGHRHLEWWTCDVDECRHVCYRRDNFLQHLVREHKFVEPKQKTKAAIKRAGSTDPTWQKVEKCKEETQALPTDEPCRFCDKRFPTWKKLTVHLAKHMEQISLPVLRLVARKELETDTIISPVQDPPPRSFPAALPNPAPNVFKREHSNPYSPSPIASQVPAMTCGGVDYSQQQHGFLPILTTPIEPLQTAQQLSFQQQQQQQQAFFGPTPHQYDNIARSFAGQMDIPVTHGFDSTSGYGGMPVTTGYMIPTANPYVSMAPEMESFPSFNPLGLQGMQDPTGTGQMPYNGMMDPSRAGGDPYTPHSSVSPYSHSPNPGQGPFYG